MLACLASSTHLAGFKGDHLFVYLLHPIVYSLVGKMVTLVGKHSWPIADSVKITASILITLITSYLVYTYFEKYFMRFGRTQRPGVSAL